MNLFINLMFYCIMPLGVLFAVITVAAHFLGTRILNWIYRDERKHSFDQHTKEHWGDAD